MICREDRLAVERAAESMKDEAVLFLQKLVRIPSVNHPPTGDEKAVQEFYADRLRSIGMKVDVFEADDVPGFAQHPARLADHDMRNRPNILGYLPGTGGGRSLLLFAHADVEAPGDPQAWTGGDPFSGEVRGGRIYGRGAADDKAGMMTAAHVRHGIYQRLRRNPLPALRSQPLWRRRKRSRAR